MDKQAVIDFILPKTADFEGFSAKVYQCPAGFDTIGYGRNIEANPLSSEERAKLVNGEVSESVAKEWLRAELERCFDKLAPLAWFRELDTQRAGAMVDMCYNLGFSGLLGFKNSLALLEAKDFKAAALNLQKSKWYSQVGRRSKAICAIISGEAMA